MNIGSIYQNYKLTNTFITKLKKSVNQKKDLKESSSHKILTVNSSNQIERDKSVNKLLFSIRKNTIRTPTHIKELKLNRADLQQSE